ncbi:MAG TPA: DUF2911 domain-containing protein [Thermoanaerobaculia bacterium]|nr:DUF2911 domain-containing protein [Thermoanaerobaculia bacterium]
MFRRTALSLLAGTVLAGAASVLAQTTSTTTTAPAAPRRAASPPGTAATQVGGKWIEITYSRPILRGRTDVFGKGADYGTKVLAGAPIWRAGANQTTRLKTEVPLEIGGKKIAPGEYSLFVDLKESGWTMIVSTQPYQEKYDQAEKAKTWGAYNYDPKFDVARVPMKMVATDNSHDQFTIGFLNVTDKGGAIAMAWEKTGAIAPFTVAQ